MVLWRLLIIGLILVARQSSAAPVDPQVRIQSQSGLANVIVGLRGSVGPLGGLTATVAAAQEAVLATADPADVYPYRRFESVAGFAASVTPAGLEMLASHPDVEWVAPDLVGTGALDRSVPQMGGDRVHARFVTGRAVTVAVIDSGIEAEHPDFAGAIVHEECFCRGTCGDGVGIFCRPDCCPDGSARASGVGSAGPGHPHGTHVAGILLSRGNVSSVGVAPDAQVIAIKVLDDGNVGQVSDWVAALDWIAVNRPDVRVINMSLASLRVFVGDCVGDCETSCDPDRGCDVGTVCRINEMFGDIVRRLRQRGTVVVAASGNQSRLNALSSPACVPEVLSVGAIDEDDEVAFFSNAGTQLDMVAPGIDIISSGLGGQQSLICGTIGGERVCGGTSMAAPHVAGAAALLVSARPSLSADAIETALVGSGVPVLDRRNRRTYPSLDVATAFRAVTRVREIELGGGSGRSDCLLGWNFRPPDVLRRRRVPVASCRDGDSFCDSDSIKGQCTFLFSLCFNVRDPLTPFCSTDETLLDIELREPAPDAPLGSHDRRNADAFRNTIPPFPRPGADLCTRLIPFVVPRGQVSSLSAATRTETRSDSDRFVLRCEGL